MQRIYRPFSISYVDPVERTLVADRRWFPVTAGLATTLARAQLDPVPDYLRGAVSTGVPLGTALTVAAVPVQSGRATVDLTVRALAADAVLRRAMWAQFLSTLLQVQLPAVQRGLAAGRRCPARPPGAGGVAVLAGRPGLPLDHHRVAGAGAAAQGQHPDPRRPRRVRRRQPAAQGTPRRARPAAADPAGAGSSWRSPGTARSSRRSVATGGTCPAGGARRATSCRASGTKLTKPSYDGRDGLWVAGERDGARACG